MRPEQKSPLVWLYRAAGAGIAIAAMQGFARASGDPVAHIPFITSIVLVMALPESEAAAPRAIIGGHLISSLCGLAALTLFASTDTASTTAVALATFLMIALRIVHPPAGFDAFVIPAFHLPAIWIVTPVFVGAVILAVFSQAWRHGEAWLFKPTPRAKRISM